MRALDPEQAVKNVGRRIAELRQSRGFTQETFAVRLGTSVQYVSRVEAGSQNLGIHSLVKIANALKVSLQELVALPTTLERPKPGRPRKTTA